MFSEKLSPIPQLITVMLSLWGMVNGNGEKVNSPQASTAQSRIPMHTMRFFIGLLLDFVFKKNDQICVIPSPSTSLRTGGSISYRKKKWRVDIIDHARRI
jgi:hypothetical protein